MAKETKKSAAPAESSAAAYLTFIAATGEGDERFEIRYEDENIWLSQRMMAELYAVDVRTINEHIKKIYADGELTESATIRKIRIVQTEGIRKACQIMCMRAILIDLSCPGAEVRKDEVSFYGTAVSDGGRGVCCEGIRGTAVCGAYDVSA